MLDPITYAADNGATLTKLGDSSLLASGGPTNSIDATYNITAQTSLTGVTGVRLEALTDASLPNNGPGRSVSGAGSFQIQEFQMTTAPVETPTVATIHPSNIGTTSATLRGSVNPNGKATNARFEWGSTQALGNTTANVAAGAGTSAIAQQFTLSGLAGVSTVYYRIVAENSSGTSFGNTVSASTIASIELWKVANLGDSLAPDMGDPDSDGLATLMEYAVGLSPVSASTTPAATLYNYAEGKRLRMFVNRDPDRGDVNLEIQAAGSASGPWMTLAISEMGAPFIGPGYFGGDGLGAGTKTVEIRDTVDLSGASMRFMRIKASR